MESSQARAVAFFLLPLCPPLSLLFLWLLLRLPLALPLAPPLLRLGTRSADGGPLDFL